MKTLICTISNEEDLYGVTVPGQVLYYYDDGTYDGVVNDKNEIDFSITYKWEVRENGEVYFKPQHIDAWHRMTKKSGEILLNKIVEFYLLKENNE
jgi:hypothetical protein